MISVAEALFILVCGGGMLLILSIGAWMLLNKSRRDRRMRMEALDREYAAGNLDEAEYDRRRSEIVNERAR